MAFAVRPGSLVRHRASIGARPRPAVVTAVTNQSTVNLRVGRTTFAAVTKVSPHATAAGWFHSGR